jgi:hypothetical protein
LFKRFTCFFKIAKYKTCAFHPYQVGIYSLGFFKEITNVERAIGNDNVKVNSFISSATSDMQAP